MCTHLPTVLLSILYIFFMDMSNKNISPAANRGHTVTIDHRCIRSDQKPSLTMVIIPDLIHPDKMMGVFFVPKIKKG